MASHRAAGVRASPTSSLLAGGSSGHGSGDRIAFQLLGPVAGAGAGAGEEGAAAARWVLGRKYDDGALIYIQSTEERLVSHRTRPSRLFCAYAPR
jgi:hypothetical protein